MDVERQYLLFGAGLREDIAKDDEEGNRHARAERDAHTPVLERSAECEGRAPAKRNGPNESCEILLSRIV